MGFEKRGQQHKDGYFQGQIRGREGAVAWEVAVQSGRGIVGQAHCQVGVLVGLWQFGSTP